MLLSSQKYSVITIYAFELDYETKLKQFMLLVDKTESERRTIGRNKKTNGFKIIFFTFFSKHSLHHCSSYANKRYIDLN